MLRIIRPAWNDCGDGVAAAGDDVVVAALEGVTSGQKALKGVSRVTTNAFASPRNRLSFQTRCTCKSTFCACISNALRWRSPVHKSQLDLYNLALVITLRYFSTSFAICLDAESSSLAFTGSTAVWEIWEAKETTVTLMSSLE
jgi:hypothetical protein